MITKRKLSKKKKWLIGISAFGVVSTSIITPILLIASNPTVNSSSAFNKEKEQNWLNENTFSIKLEEKNRSITPFKSNSLTFFSLAIESPNYFSVKNNLESIEFPEDFSEAISYKVVESIPEQGKILANIHFQSGAIKEKVEISNFLTTSQAENILKQNLSHIKIFSANPSISYTNKYYEDISKPDSTIKENETNINKDYFFEAISNSIAPNLESVPKIFPNDFIILGLPKNIPVSFVRQFISVSPENQTVRLDFNGFDYPSVIGIKIQGFKPVSTNVNSMSSYNSDLEKLKSLTFKSKPIELPKQNQLDSNNIFSSETLLENLINLNESNMLNFIKDNLLLNYLSNVTTTEANFTIILKSGAKFTWESLKFNNLKTEFSSINDLYKYAENQFSNLSIQELEFDLQNMNVKNGQIQKTKQFINPTPQSYWSASSFIDKIRNSEVKINNKSGLNLSISYLLDGTVKSLAPIVGEATGEIKISSSETNLNFVTTQAKIQPLLFWSEKDESTNIFKIFTYPSIQTLYAGGDVEIDAPLSGRFFSAGGNTLLNSPEIETKLPKEGAKINIGYMLVTPDSSGKFIPNLNSTQIVKASISTSKTNSSQNLSYFSFISNMLPQDEKKSLEDVPQKSSIIIRSSNSYYDDVKNGIVDTRKQDLYLENKIHFETHVNPYSKDESGNWISKLGSKSFSNFSFTIQNQGEIVNNSNFYNKQELDTLLDVQIDELSKDLNQSTKKINLYFNEVFQNLEQNRVPAKIGRDNLELAKLDSRQFILKNGFRISLNELVVEDKRIFAKMNLIGAINYLSYFDKLNPLWLNLNNLSNVEVEIIPMIHSLSSNNNHNIYSKYEINSLSSSITNKNFDLIKYEKNLNESKLSESIPSILKNQKISNGFYLKFKNSDEKTNNNLFASHDLEFAKIFGSRTGISSAYFSLSVLTLQYAVLKDEISE
ncbi:hypothetical protein [[Mycoplasma] mobile]|uniref:Expressed protein n=1 Tax=Mycoplasma mobile (strain ATCC 43663 / 163K / NCTC 11711) TaxID=267748 RepID=Q6KH71_MYCM1|nr:hypothetical protein [[Mycoplasma] mobile]AAT28059.1 expressed protein [Mycoplasma mobile 163K]